MSSVPSLCEPLCVPGRPREYPEIPRGCFAGALGVAGVHRERTRAWFLTFGQAVSDHCEHDGSPARLLAQQLWCRTGARGLPASLAARTASGLQGLEASSYDVMKSFHPNLFLPCL